MNPKLNIPLLIILCFWGTTISGNSADRLSEIQTAFKRAVTKEENQLSENVRQLRERYKRSLEKLLSAKIASGDANAALIVNREISLVDSKNGLEINASEELPPQIREMRSKFVEAKAKFIETKDQSVADLKIKGVVALSQLARSVTRAGDLVMAEKIQEQIAEWKDSNSEGENRQSEFASIDVLNGAILKNFEKGEILWSDKRVEILDIPRGLENLFFVFCSKELSSATIKSSGKVFVITAAPQTPNDRSEELKSLGFKKSRIRPFQLYGSHHFDQVETYEKVVNTGESLQFRKYGIIVAHGSVHIK